jgi:hypothetical protein
LVEKTSYEAWTSKKPSFKNLRFFGCDAYVHVPKENRSKLDNKDEKSNFHGHKVGIKGYKLWDSVTNKIVYNQDVVFREVKEVPRKEVMPRENEPKMIELELEDEESKSTKEDLRRRRRTSHSYIEEISLREKETTRVL